MTGKIYLYTVDAIFVNYMNYKYILSGSDCILFRYYFLAENTLMLSNLSIFTFLILFMSCVKNIFLYRSPKEFSCVTFLKLFFPFNIHIYNSLKLISVQPVDMDMSMNTKYPQHHLLKTFSCPLLSVTTVFIS